jgi:putative peptidoglycan lipid II flippase
VLGESVVSRAVTPVLERKLAREGDDAARAFYLRARGARGAVLVLVTALGMLFAEPLTELLAYGYRARPGELQRTVLLTQTLFPLLLLGGSTAIGEAVLRLKKRPAFHAAAPIFVNAGLVLGMISLPSLLDARGIDRAQSMAIGALLGGLVQVVVCFMLLRKVGWRGQAIVDLKDPAVRDMLRRTAPLALNIAVYYVDLVLSRRFLSALEVGAQSWFSWAMRLCETAQWFLAFTVVTTPPSTDDRGKVSRATIAAVCSDGLRHALFVAIPVSVAFTTLAAPIVVAVFQRGELDANSAVQISRALVWQGGAVWVAVATRHLVRALYSLRDTRTPLVASVLGVVVFVVLALWLPRYMGHVGISAAVAGSSVGQAAWLLLALRRRLGALRIAPVLASAVRTLLAALLASAGGAGAAVLLTPGAGAGGLARAVPGVVAVAVFAAAFIGLAWAVHLPELAALVSYSRRQRAKRLALEGRA